MPELRHYVGPACPLNRAAYAYVLNLCPSDLAWEFLRRNPSYQRDYGLSRRSPDRSCRIGPTRWLTRLRRVPPQSYRWGLSPLVDPKWPAPQAPLCWRMAASAPVLDARAERASPGAPSSLSIVSCVAATHIVIGPAGEEYIIFRDAERAATLRLEGARASLGPVNLTFLIAGLPDTGTLTKRLSALSDLITAPRLSAPPSRMRLFLRDALLALDARQIGMSHREIAALLDDTEGAHESEFRTTEFLRARVRHAILRGQQFRDGEYRKLLA
jgi:hypothetical protein